jgi:hypothetical protein
MPMGRFLDAPAMNAMPSLVTYADTFCIAEYTFETGGNADPQGWIPVDATARGSFWHVDDFDGLAVHTPLEGNQSMWCGARPSTEPELCAWSALPGYGNGWDTRFTSQALTVEGDVTVSYLIHFDSEPGYDVTRLEYLGQSGEWQQLAEYDGPGWQAEPGKDSLEVIVVPADSLDGTITLRFRFSSDGAWSNEDGLFAVLSGASYVDSITVADTTGVVNYQDFETEAVGAETTTDGTWAATPAPAFGSVAALYPGLTLLQEDDCRTNLSWVWAFLEGSTELYDCGSIPGQIAVPKGKPGDIPGTALYIRNEIWSPLIDMSKDVNGNPVPADAQEVLYGFDVYADLPLNNLVFYNWAVRTWNDGCPNSRWKRFTSVYYQPSRVWYGWPRNVTRLVNQNDEFLQVRMDCIDMCAVWCGVFGTGECHTHTPLFDNVKVMRVRSNGPSWVVDTRYLFQDNFAGDGTKTGTVRADMALDLLPSGNPSIIPGDSIAFNVSSLDGDLDSHVSGMPATGPAVYIHVKDTGAKSGAAISGDVTRWPLIATGGGWTVLQADTARTSSGGLISDRYCFDLNDNFYTPGDTICYYFSARDAGGTTSYYSVLTGPVLSQGDVIAMPMEMTCLPANGKNGITDILYVDGFDGRGAQPYFDSAFDVLGLTPDRYDINRPSANEGNGPAGRVVDVLQQISSCYKKIIWNTGDLFSMGDGIVAKQDDFGLLYTFLHLSPDSAGVYLSGDDIAEFWFTSTGVGAINLRSQYMNFNLIGGDHVLAGEPVTPTAVGIGGSCFEHGSVPDTLLVYGGCPAINDFDLLTPTGSAVLEMAYASGNGAVVAQTTTNSVSAKARVILSGFSYHEIHDDKVSFPPDRIDHLRDIILWLGNEVPSPTAVPAPPLFSNALAQNYPNPFNPTTQIRYSIRKRGHVSLDVYNVAGQRVRTLVSEVQLPRPQGFAVTWDGTSDAGDAVSSGVYFYKLSARGFTKTKKMVLLK